MNESNHPRLVGDIGGTNARFGWIESPGEAPTMVGVYQCAEFPTLQAAMGRYLEDHGKLPPAWCAIGIANPVTGDEVRMTNHVWSFSIEAVRRHFGYDRFVVINDFTALALALLTLNPDERVQVGGGAAAEGAAIGLIGPGTGLGVSGLLPGLHGGRMVPVNGEGGHVTLPAGDAFEHAVVASLQRRFGHASAERALSGPGLVNLYEAICQVEGVPALTLEAAEVTTRSDAQCQRAVDVFLALLGAVAGNLALTLGARGGVYIGGGIVPRLMPRLMASSFRERFEAKGRFRSYLEPIPVYVVTTATSPALDGAARALDSL